VFEYWQAVSIDQLNRADFFRWEQPDIVGVDRDSLPELTTLHVQSRLVDTRKLKERDYSGIFSQQQYRQFDDGEASYRIRRLAQRWTFGKQKGWEQIDSIIKHLREEYTLDDSARATGDSGHTVSEFLFETKRGPDYLFATSAVWLLRSLDYPARFVSGFYATPDRYEARTGLTPILAEDVHCWAEVLVQRDYWVTLEPSPGYAVLLPPLSLAEQIAGILNLVYTRLLRYPFTSGALLFLLVFESAVVSIDQCADSKY
jgi:transglutaminase-like putative cysteine protease